MPILQRHGVMDTGRCQHNQQAEIRIPSSLVMDGLPSMIGRMSCQELQAGTFCCCVPGCFLRPGPAPHFLVFLSLTANLKVLAAFLSSGTSITAFLLVFFSQSQMHSGLQCIQFPASSLLLKTNSYTFCIQSNFMQVQQGSRVEVAEIRNL